MIWVIIIPNALVYEYGNFGFMTKANFVGVVARPLYTTNQQLLLQNMPSHLPWPSMLTNPAGDQAQPAVASNVLIPDLTRLQSILGEHLLPLYGGFNIDKNVEGLLDKFLEDSNSQSTSPGYRSLDHANLDTDKSTPWEYANSPPYTYGQVYSEYPLYQNSKTGPDGLYHCLWEGNDVACNDSRKG
jgi:hypothetical protein